MLVYELKTLQNFNFLESNGDFVRIDGNKRFVYYSVWCQSKNNKNSMMNESHWMTETGPHCPIPTTTNSFGFTGDKYADVWLGCPQIQDEVVHIQ